MARPKAGAGDTRAQILEAALGVIAQSGERSLRTKAVAEGVGVTEPTLFHYFGSREGLVEAAQVERFRRSQLDVYVPFRAAVIDCSRKSDFVSLCRQTTLRALDAERFPIRAERIEILGSALTRPDMFERIRELQIESSKVLSEALEIARARKWLPNELDTKAAAYWLIGAITGRVFAEISGDAQVIESHKTLLYRSFMWVLGLS